MEAATESGELLENVVIGDVNAPQYMIQRLPENSQLLSSELLQHNGLVVDLSGGDFIPVTYPAAETLLSHDLTEAAAALVAVQFNQQQKHQQLLDATTLPPLGNKMLDEHQQLILSENLYIDKQALIAKIQNENGFVTPNFEQNLVTEKSEDEKKTSDGENRYIPTLTNEKPINIVGRNDTRSARKSLPHKKRISRKLKKNASIKYECNQCGQHFMGNEEFAQHEILCQTTITPITPAGEATSTFSCQLCNAPFQDQLRFFEHLKSHYEPQTGAPQKVEQNTQSPEKDSLLNSLLCLTCICCNKTFRKQKALEVHMKEMHQNKVEQNEFSETEDLMAGINVVVDNNDHSSDDNDTKSWYREEDLHQTEEDLKELEATEHICHICKQPFPLRAILLQHLVTCRANNGNNEEPAAPLKKKFRKRGNLHCTECDRVFTHRNSLVYHIRSHTGIRPHQCDQCGKSFFASSALKVHLRLHSGDKPYHCDECGKNFRQWGDLKYHITSLHSNERQFQCEYCGKDFARKYSLIVHRRIHTGEKNYKCEFCSKSFRASSYLQNHRKIHTGEKPHECEICGKPFRVRSDMKRHQKTHHSKRISGKPMRFAATNTQAIVRTKIDNPELIEGEESTNEILGYDPGELDAATVRDGNSLYSNGPQLFLVSYATSADVKNVDTNWIHTSS